MIHFNNISVTLARRKRFGTLSLAVHMALFAMGGIGVDAQSILIVRGKVVDDSETWLKGALVCLFVPPCKTCLDQISPCMRSAEGGDFSLDVRVSKDDLKGTIYIEGPLPKGFRLIYNPFFQLAGLDRYKGTEFLIPDQGTVIDLQRIKPSVSYSSVTIDLSKYIEDADTIPNLQQKALFRLRDVNGRKITDMQKIPAAYWTGPTTLNLVLPDGKWRVEVEFIGLKGKRQVVTIDLMAAHL